MSNRWNIVIEYGTGDSFNSYDASGEIPIVWSDLNKAKEALARIKAVDKWDKYNDNQSTWPIINRDETPPEKPDDFFPKVDARVGDLSCCSMLLQLDDGTEQQVHTFWRGYFEHIRSVKIIPYTEPLEDGDDMTYTP